VPKVVPVRVVISAEVEARLSIVALVDLSVVIVADVKVALESDRLDTVRLVTAKFVTEAEVENSVLTVPLVEVRLVRVADPLVRVVIPAEVLVRVVIVALFRETSLSTASVIDPVEFVTEKLDPAVKVESAYPAPLPINN